MKVVASVLAFLCTINLYSQADSAIYAIPNTDKSFLYFNYNNQCFGIGMIEVESPNKFVVIDHNKCTSEFNSSNFFKVIFREIEYYIRAEDIKNYQEVIRRFQNLTLEQKDRLILLSKKSSIYLDSIYNARINKKDSVENIKRNIYRNKVLQKYSQYGLIILDLAAYDESEFTKGTGLNFSFLNYSKRTIKYIWITVVGINSVGDPVKDPMKKTTMMQLEGIGPVLPGEEGSYSFEYVWFTDLTNEVQLKSCRVQYIDGASKTFSNPSQLIISESERKAISDILPFDVDRFIKENSK